MKKLIVLLIAMLPFVEGMAQEFEFGLQVSPGVHFLNSPNKDINTGAKLGFTYGLLVNYLFTDRYGISTGFNIVHSGGKAEFNGRSILEESDNTGLNVDQDHRYKTTALEIPISFVLNTNEMGYFTYFGQIGLTTSFRLNARKDYLETGVFLQENVKTEEINLIRMGLNFGGGVKYSIASDTQLFGMIYYDNGFTNMVKDILPDTDDDKVVLNMIGLRVGVIF